MSFNQFRPIQPRPSSSSKSTKRLKPGNDSAGSASASNPTELVNEPRLAKSGEMPVHPHLYPLPLTQRNNAGPGTTVAGPPPPHPVPSFQNHQALSVQTPINPLQSPFHPTPSASYQHGTPTTPHQGARGVSSASLSVYQDDLHELLQSPQWMQHPSQRQQETEVMERQCLERALNNLKAENECLNNTLRSHDFILFQRNAEWLQLCEENRTLRTDLKSLQSTHELLLREVSSNRPETQRRLN